MILLRWWREYLEMRREFKPDPPVCESCETLKFELERLRDENEKLVNHILDKPKVVETEPDTKNLKPILPSRTPWRVQRQMLEAEDREKARAMRNAAKPDSEHKGPREVIKTEVTPETTIEELEKDLDIAGQEREATK